MWGSTQGPDPHRTVLLLSFPLAPRDLCGWWLLYLGLIWQVMEREEGCSKSSDFWRQVMVERVRGVEGL